MGAYCAWGTVICLYFPGECLIFLCQFQQPGADRFVKDTGGYDRLAGGGGG